MDQGALSLMPYMDLDVRKVKDPNGAIRTRYKDLFGIIVVLSGHPKMTPLV